jgi:hypothetical protein
LIGGIFLLLGGLLATVGFSFVFGGLGALVGIVGVIFGLIVILGAVMLYQKPQSHTMWGVVILILSIIAFPSLWGFGIGSLLAFIGAILALVYKPSIGPSGMPSQPMGSMPTGSMGSSPTMGSMGMTCKNCGASIPAGATRCPSCGAAV